MKNLKETRIVHIEIQAIPGGELSYCIREAIEIAAREWQNVKLIHNNRKYHIDIDTSSDAILGTVND